MYVNYNGKVYEVIGEICKNDRKIYRLKTTVKEEVNYIDFNGERVTTLKDRERFIIIPASYCKQL